MKISVLNIHKEKTWAREDIVVTDCAKQGDNVHGFGWCSMVLMIALFKL